MSAIPETVEVLLARYGPRYRIFVILTSMLGTISAVLTTTTVNVALPDIMGSFGIGQERAQLISAGALAGMTIGMLLNAWLMDSFGQRNTFVGALAIFVVALLVAGLSPNELVLIMARVVQGVIAGVLQSLNMYTSFSVYPPGQRGRAMGFSAIAIILGPAIGPTLGGIMIEHFNWRFVFYAALPFCAAGLLLGVIFMPERDVTTKRAHFDWTGFLLLCVTMWCLLIGLSNGQREGWESDFVLGLLALSAGACICLVLWELRVSQPLVNLRVLACGQFTAAACVAVIFGLGMFGSTYLVPLFVQTIQGFTPYAAGLMLLPGGLILGVFMPFGGYMSDKLPARPLIITGLLCFAASSYWLGAIDVNTSFWGIAICVVVNRIGLALIKPTLNVNALRSLPPELLGQGSGMINFSRQLGGAFGVNLLSVYLDRRTFYYSDVLTSMQTAANSATSQLRRSIESLLAQTGASTHLQSDGALHFLGRVVHAQASTLAFRDSFMIVTLIFILALIPAWIMGRKT